MSVVTYIVLRFVVFLCAAIGHHMDQSVDPATRDIKMKHEYRIWENENEETGVQ